MYIMGICSDVTENAFFDNSRYLVHVNYDTIKKHAYLPQRMEYKMYDKNN